MKKKTAAERRYVSTQNVKKGAKNCCVKRRKVQAGVESFEFCTPFGDSSRQQVAAGAIFGTGAE